MFQEPKNYTDNDHFFFEADNDTHTDKYGKLRRYIKFYSPVDKRIIEMQVYSQYNIGEKFEKEMKIGRWNILHSKD